MTDVARTFKARGGRPSREVATAHLTLHGWEPIWFVALNSRKVVGITDSHCRVLDLARGATVFYGPSPHTSFPRDSWNLLSESAFWRVHDHAIDERLLPLEPV